MGLFDHLIRDVRSVIDRDGGQNAIPPLDGALSPNDQLDTCVPIGEPLPGVDGAEDDEAEVYSTGYDDDPARAGKLQRTKLAAVQPVFSEGEAE